jgi:hypothetical protein
MTHPQPWKIEIYYRIQESWTGDSVKRWYWVHPVTGRTHGPFQQEGGAFGDARLALDQKRPLMAERGVSR